MKFFGKELTFNNFKVYTENDKPTPSEIGASEKNHTHKYTDLIEKPTIPTKLSQLENDTGFTKNAIKVTSSSIEPSQPQKGDLWI